MICFVKSLYAVILFYAIAVVMDDAPTQLSCVYRPFALPLCWFLFTLCGAARLGLKLLLSWFLTAVLPEQSLQQTLLRLWWPAAFFI